MLLARSLSVFLICVTLHSTSAAENPKAFALGVTNQPLELPSDGKPGFLSLSSDQTHLTFTNLLDADASAANRVLNNGSGVAAGDFDNDGRVDLFFCSLNNGNKLFRNLGNWKFEDVTEKSGLKFAPGFYRAATFADLNGDGSLDLLVGTVSTGVHCFLNDGHGRFTEFTDQAGTLTSYANETLALADIDNNGTLDLYAANNRSDDIRDWARVPVMYVNSKPTVPPQMKNRITLENGTLQEYGEPDILYMNDGHAHFRPVSWTNGAFLDEHGRALTNAPLDWGLTAAFRDLNNDGAPDLYVCNDYWTPDRIWLNDGLGHFKALATLAIRKTPASSMGVDFSDINRDGYIDIFAVDMLSRSSELRKRQMVAKRPVPPRIGDLETRVQAPQNTLLLNRGDGTFAEIARFAGVEASDWSWSPVFLDVDLDGYDDLLITSGHLRDIQDLDANEKIRLQQAEWRRSPMAATNLQQAFVQAKREHAKAYPSLQMPIVAFRNSGNLQFTEVTTNWGLGTPNVNHGIAFADLDGDGDLDLVVNRLGSPAGVFRNESPAPRLAVRLHGKAPNTQAIGAKMELLGATVSNQVQEVTCGGTYMSGHDTLRVFAPGSNRGPFTLQITWRDGTVTKIPGILANQRYDIDETKVSHTQPARVISEATAPLFKDVSDHLAHVHHETPYNDFARQPLLPRKLSQSGPGIAWFDLDGDGWDDLVIGTGRGGRTGLYRNREGKLFEKTSSIPEPAASDQTMLLGMTGRNGERLLFAGSSSYEENLATAPSVEILNFASHKSESPIAGSDSSVGPLALADYEGNNTLGLFVGGNVVPGRYPAPASSRLFRRSENKWVLDEANTKLLANIGLVNAALWSDLDGDGWPELILACEWGPIRIFSNQHGKLWEETEAMGLSANTGLWQSVAVADVNGDGKLDIIAGNWGLNSAWHASPAQPLTMVYGDLAGRNTSDILETEYDNRTEALVPRGLRDTLAVSLPFLTARFPSHAAWSKASLKDVLQEHEPSSHRVTAKTLASTIFLNRNGKFEARPLPAEAQFSPTLGIAVADFDGDGHEDLFLAQNFFAFPTEDSRQDASRGLLLRGDGHGGFESVPGQRSGLKLYGEQRGAAVADYDHDGRPDLVVTQNGAATHLFHNTTGRPGLRIRLHGPEGNPDAIGARVRLKFASGLGPVREIHAGSGYWSQDSSTIVLAAPTTPLAVEVLWPGGHRTETPVPPAAKEMHINR